MPPKILIQSLDPELAEDKGRNERKPVPSAELERKGCSSRQITAYIREKETYVALMPEPLSVPPTIGSTINQSVRKNISRKAILPIRTRPGMGMGERGLPTSIVPVAMSTSLGTAADE